MNFGEPQGSLGGNLMQAEQDYPSGKMVRMPTMKDRLALAVAQAEQRLKEAKRAKEIFDAHPDLEELLNIMQNGHF